MKFFGLLNLILLSTYAFGLSKTEFKANSFQGITYLYGYSNQIFTTTKKEDLKSKQFNLIKFIRKGTYEMHFQGSYNQLNDLSETMNIHFESIPIYSKATPSLLAQSNGSFRVIIAWQPEITGNQKKKLLRNWGVLKEHPKRISKKLSVVTLETQQIQEIVSHPAIRFINSISKEDQALNITGKASAGVGHFQLSMSPGLQNLKGQGIVVGHGDNADLHAHVDLQNRFYDFNGSPARNHGTHTAATLIGAGTILTEYEGMLPEAELVSQFFSNILLHLPTYDSLYNISVTNNSYSATSGSCLDYGQYDLLSENIDQLSLDIPSITNVFAAGNRGRDSSCLVYPVKHGTIMGQYQASKNTIIVGNITVNDTLYNSSSRGPIKTDGRLKPDVVAIGTALYSATIGNNYFPDWGTSMAAPIVSGLVGITIQRYKQLHQTELSSDAVKALILNGAYDLGRPGPDVTYGYGRISAYRTLQMLEKNMHWNGSVAHQDSMIYNLNLNSDYMYKFLMYYHDQPGIPYQYPSLINNLDFYILSPSGQKILPMTVRTNDSLGIFQDATPNVDSLNNTEQIILNHPTSGSYQLIVKGKQVVTPYQKFVIAYDSISPHLFLRSPTPSKPLIANTPLYINWDVYDTAKHNITIDYKIVPGGAWQNITSNLSDSITSFKWIPPAAGSKGLQIRLTSNRGLSTISNTILSTPRPLMQLRPISQRCPGYVPIYWDPVPQASKYYMYLMNEKNGKHLQLIDSTTDTFYTYRNLRSHEYYYYSFSAKMDDAISIRSKAIRYRPSGGGCNAPLYEQDLEIESISSPVFGRQYSTTALSSSESVTLTFKNLGPSITDSALIRYRINSPTWTNRKYFNLPPKSRHNIALTLDFSSPNTYILETEIINLGATDSNATNNKLSHTIRQATNSPILIDSPYKDGFESVMDTLAKTQMGLMGGERWDFLSTSSVGQLRSFIRPRFAITGQKSISLDVSSLTNNPVINQLIGTFNLDSFTVDSNRIRLDFDYKHHSESVHNANVVRIRDHDNGTWRVLYDLARNQNLTAGEVKQVQSLELDKILRDQGEEFTTTTQLSFGQIGLYGISDNEGLAGYTFDNIKIYKVQKDVILSQIISPEPSSCGLSSTEKVQIQVRNPNLFTVYNITAAYQIDGNAWVQESIDSIPADSSLIYTFTTQANIISIGKHTIQTYINYNGDDYSTNDSIMNHEIYHFPNETNYPSLARFDIDNNHWIPFGLYSSWERGTPTLPDITNTTSGKFAWVTHAKGTYNNNENSYLISPCYELKNLDSPMLSFNMAYAIENCGNKYCDGAWLETSYNNGATWEKLDHDTSITKTWYSDTLFYVWNGKNVAWKGYTIPINKNKGDNIRFRFVMNSDAGYELDGIAVDDIHIYNYNGKIISENTPKTVISSYLLPNTQQIAKTIEGVIGSVTPLQQPINELTTTYYPHLGSIRTLKNEYYLDRNITLNRKYKSIKDSSLIQIYFTQEEINRIINDTKCAFCKKPKDISTLNVLQFTSILDSTENGFLHDNNIGIYKVNDYQNVNITPYLNGYYAEFYTLGFSEFWLTFAGDTTYHKNMFFINTEGYTQEKKARITWDIKDENNNHHFEIYRAEGDQGLQNNAFIPIGQVISQGNGVLNSYEFIDISIPNLNEVYYYQILYRNNAGAIGLSDTISVVFGSSKLWKIQPNPATTDGTYLHFQLPRGSVLNYSIYDVLGRNLGTNSIQADGTKQKVQIARELPKGVYHIRVYNTNKIKEFKLLKK